MSKLYKIFLGAVLITGTMFVSSQQIEINPQNTAAQIYGATFTGEVKVTNNTVTMDGATVTNDVAGTSNNQAVDILVTNLGTPVGAAQNFTMTLTDSYLKTNSVILCGIMDGNNLANGDVLTLQVTTRSNGSCVITGTSNSAGFAISSMHFSVLIFNP